MVVSIKSMISKAIKWKSTATKPTEKRIVCTKSDAGEPSQRVIPSAVFLNEDSFSMRGVYTQHQRFDYQMLGIEFMLILCREPLVLGIPSRCYNRSMLVGNVQFVSGRASMLPLVLRELEKSGVEVSGNPDVYIRHVGNFGIDEARDLTMKAVLRPVAGGRRYFLIVVDAITAEAQNALLKTLEETPGDAMFIFIHPVPQTLLPTVRSRAQMVRLGESAEESMIDARQFLNATPAKRLDMLKPILEKGDDERRDFGAIIEFLSSLERELDGVKRSASALHAVYRARRYIGDRGALVKPLLEQVALLI